MLRIITQQLEARAELERICDRTHDDQVIHKEATVRAILLSVKRQQDRALLQYTAECDQPTLQPEDLRVRGAELDAAYQQIPKELLDAIRFAYGQIEAFHRQRSPKSWVQFEDDQRVRGKRYTPVDRAGIYIEGGRATNPSTVLMNAIPAVVAGVPHVVMVTPSGPHQPIHPAVLVAAQEAGIQEIYRVGGAQAIAALAYGTETIPAVDVITGSGDIYVTLAKQLVHGTVGIDGLNGPSELIIIADHSAHPAYVAADLLAQAEQDPMAAAILITPDPKLADQVVTAVEQRLQAHPHRLMTEKAIAHHGLGIVVDSLQEAADLANGFGPANLTLAIADPWTLLDQIRHAGAILLGTDTPTAVTHCAGPNLILPTSGASRYASPLGVETFMKQTHVIQYSPQALAKVADTLDRLAAAGGFTAQQDAVRLRTAGPPTPNDTNPTS